VEHIHSPQARVHCVRCVAKRPLREGARATCPPPGPGLATFRRPSHNRRIGSAHSTPAKDEPISLPRVGGGYAQLCGGLLALLATQRPPHVSSALAGANVGHVDRAANAPAPLPDGSYPLTLAEEAQETDSPPVNAYLLTMLMLACSFGSSVLRMLLTNARRQGAICSWCGDDRGWLAVAHEEPSVLGVFRL